MVKCPHCNNQLQSIRKEIIPSWNNVPDKNSNQKYVAYVCSQCDKAITIETNENINEA